VSLRDLTSAVLVFLAYQSANGQPVTGAPSSAQQPISLSAVGPRRLLAPYWRATVVGQPWRPRGELGRGARLLSRSLRRH
jgi:hypothetical protein